MNSNKKQDSGMLFDRLKIDVLIWRYLFMRSNEERLQLLHKRSKKLKEEKDKKILLLYGTICSVLLVALFSVTLELKGQPSGTADGLFTGSSLLSEAAGGYVMVAVAAFMLGVVITVMLKKYQKSKKHKKSEEIPSEGKNNL